MRITGTKKLLIIMLAVLSVIAVSFGLLYNGSAKAEEVTPSQSSAVLEEDGEPHQSPLETSTASPLTQGEAENKDELTQGEAEGEDEESEDEYDADFDEGALRDISQDIDIDFDLVNFYAHANKVTVSELQAQLAESAEHEAELQALADSGDQEALDKALEEHNCEEHDLGTKIADYKFDYIEGKVQLEGEDEQEDWFLDPDEASGYATYYYCGGYACRRLSSITSNRRGNISVSWQYHTTNNYNWGDYYNCDAYAGSTGVYDPVKNTQYYMRPSEGGWGMYTTVTLDPGETLKLTGTFYCGHGSWSPTSTNHAWAENRFTDSSASSSYGIIDGDAPTGSYYMLGNSNATSVPWNSRGAYYRFRQSYTGCSTSSNHHAMYFSKIWWMEIIIIRRDADRPTLVDDNDGGVISGNTKTIFYDGNPAKISMYPDWGSGMLSWQASSSNVTLYDRARHGAAVHNITFQASVAGEYTITLTSFSGTWADGSSGPVTFKFILKTQTTSKPRMRREAGVADNLKSKYVNDTGEMQTVTFENCDPAFLSWDSNGLIQDSWDPVTKILVLRQDKQNVYNINIYITNTAGCTWTDGSKGTQSFQFTIGPMLIDKPNIDGISGLTKTVTYNGEQQSMVLRPAKQGSLVVVAAGIDPVYNTLDITDPDNAAPSDFTLTFTSTNANKFNIIIYPADGYVWRDGTKTRYTYVFDIQTVKLQAPRLDEPSAVNGTKTVTYDPSGAFQTMSIMGADKNGLDITSAMQVGSWDDDGNLVMQAQSAITYYIGFRPKTNYEWAPGVTAPTFVLIVNRYQLGTPYIIVSDYEQENHQVEGTTKTVAYEGRAEDKFLRLYIGLVGDGVAVTDQISIVDAGLLMQWEDQTTLLLKQTEAYNYIVDIIPTSNYMWTDGTFGLKSFKLEITPRLRDAIPMFIQNEAGGWNEASGNVGTLRYDGTEKYMKIGRGENELEHFSPSEMYYNFVDTSDNVITNSKLTLKTSGNGELVFAAVDAGTYRVRVNLMNSNYAWRDGSGISLYFTLIIEAMPIAKPKILATECFGYQTEGKIYEKLMEGVYDGNPFTLTIACKSAPDIIKITTASSVGPDGIWQSSWESAADYDRLVMNAIETGTHTVRIEIHNTNYCWEEDVPYYEFQILIDFAEVSGVEFFQEVVVENSDTGEVDNFGYVSRGFDTSSGNSTFITDYLQNIKVQRKDVTQFAKTEFESQFVYEIIGKPWGPDNSNGDAVYNGNDNLVLSFLNAGRYTVQISLTDNYCWVGGSRDPWTFTFEIAAKKVDVPYLYEGKDANGNIVNDKNKKYYFQEDGTQIGSVDHTTRTRKVTFNRADQQLMIMLGRDWKAFNVKSTTMTPDTTVVTSADHAIAFLAKNAGAQSHYVTLELADKDNYDWDLMTEPQFTLSINKLAVYYPEAYVVNTQLTGSEDDLHAGATSPDNDSLALDRTNSQELTLEYTGNMYYVYLFGDVIKNSCNPDLTRNDMNLTVTVEDGNGNKNLSSTVKQHEGKYVAYEFNMMYADKYTITLSFNPGPNGEDNYYWHGESGENKDDCEFKFTINKMSVQIPTIDVTNTAFDPDNANEGVKHDATVDPDKWEAHFVYNYEAREIIIDGYVPNMGDTGERLMRVSNDSGLTTANYDSASKLLSFKTNSVASVGTEYKLQITLDEKNMCWDSGVADDTTAKNFCIVIEKLPIAKPTITDDPLDEDKIDADGNVIPDSNLQTVSKTYQKGKTWPNAMKIEGLLLAKDGASGLPDGYRGIMSYKLASPTTMTAQETLVTDDYSLDLNVMTDNAGTYTVIVSLIDTVNLCWDDAVNPGNSGNLDLSFIIKPYKVDAPVIKLDGDAVDNDNDGIPDNFTPIPVPPDEAKYTGKTITYDGIEHYLTILKYLPTDENMSVEVISANKFSDMQIDTTDPDNPLLVYSATNAGKYVVRFSLSSNACWADGTNAPIELTFTIEKKQYDTPFIFTDRTDGNTQYYNPQDPVYSDPDHPGYIDPSADPNLVPDTQLNGFVKTVSYIWDEANKKGQMQYLSVELYNKDIMDLQDFVRPDTESTSSEPNVAENKWKFGVTDAGVYTMTFRLKDFRNNRWKFADAETVTFTFVVEKYKITMPVIASDYLTTNEKLNAAGTSLSSSYDGNKHTLLLPNIHSADFIRANDVTNYTGRPEEDKMVIPKDGNGDAIIRSNPQGADTAQTVASVLGYDANYTFSNGSINDTTVIDKVNYITATATAAGNYTLRFTISGNKENMCWADGTDTDKDISVNIAKVKHALPQLVPGTKASAEYTGGEVKFYIRNVYNGCKTLAEWQAVKAAMDANQPTTGLYSDEELDLCTIDEYTTSVVSGAKLEIESWFNGTLTLKAKEVGSYTLTISIKNPATTEWTGYGSTSMPFKFDVVKRKLTPAVNFFDTNNITTSLGSSWGINTQPTARITLTNVAAREFTPGTPEPDLRSLAVHYYYLKNGSPATQIGEGIVNGADFGNAVMQSNGLYTVYFDVPMHYFGDDSRADKGKYSFYVEMQGDSTTYEFKTTPYKKNYSIGAEAAPFNPKNIVWRFSSDGGINYTYYTLSGSTLTSADVPAGSTVIDTGLTDWNQMSAANAVKVPYSDGVKYEFELYMEPAGMAGWNNDPDGPYEDINGALLSWKVKLDSANPYRGDKVGMYAGEHKVYAPVYAADSAEYAYTTRNFELYYEITKAKYDLKDLKWDYDSTTNFVYDGTPKTVSLTGDYPTGLSVKNYQANNGALNTQIKAGTYQTFIEFTTSNKNYMIPDMSDPDTYLNTGTTFEWSVNWSIAKAALHVDWSEKKADSGTALFYVPVLASDNEKVVYTFETSTDNVNWTAVDDASQLKRNDGVNEYFHRVTVSLKPGNTDTTDYANNYYLYFDSEADPTADANRTKAFTLSQGDLIGVQVYMNGDETNGDQIGTDPSNARVFSYNGDPFQATAFIFNNPDSSVITLDNIVITYYSMVNTKKPIAVPSEPGKYMIKLTLVGITDNGTGYELGDSEFYFDIDKAKFDTEKIYWLYTHDDGVNPVVEAKYNFATGQWLDTTTNEEVTFVYDGYGHTVELISEEPNLKVTTKNKAYLHAGRYVSKATFTYDGSKYYDPVIAKEMEWEIDKAVLDLSSIEWDYDPDEFVYTLKAGAAKNYSVELILSSDLDYLLDYIFYTTYDADDYAQNGADAELIPAVQNKVGKYVTVCNFENLPVDSDYVIGDWPATVARALNWEISARTIVVPDGNATWTEFNGSWHDLLGAITVQQDWEEYFDISVEYAAPDSKSFAAYDGSDDYGKYYAFNAGSYRYTFSIKPDVNKDGVNVQWDDGTGTPTTDDQTVTLDIAKAEMEVYDWFEQYEASHVRLSGDYVNQMGEESCLKFIGYEYYRGAAADVSPANKVTLSDVLNAYGLDPVMFTMVPYIKTEYQGNITLTFSDPAEETYTFETEPFVPDPSDPGNTDTEPPTAYTEQVPERPYIIGYTTEDGYYEFTDEDWFGFLGIELDDVKVKDIVNGATEEELTLAGISAIADGEEPGEAHYEFAKSKLLTPEAKSKATVSVTYGGKPITFVIYKWDTAYYQYLDLIDGDATVDDAGAYKLTYILKRDAQKQLEDGSYVDNYLYWSKQLVDGKYVYDRSAVELNFEIKYKMLPIPELKDITYTGSPLNILEQSYTEEAYRLLMETYGDFIDIIGYEETEAGTYKLQLTIREEYITTIRWDDGTPAGIPGTVTLTWKLLPIYLIKPVLNPDVTVTYDGSEHSVFEVLMGYDKDNMPEDLLNLLKYARIPGEGSRAIDAGSYKATFNLPSTNYAWMDATGAVDTTATSISIDWKVEKKFLDLRNLNWGYETADEPVIYSEDNPYVFAFENGAVKPFTLELLGLPEELKEFLTYLTDGSMAEGNNTKSAVGKYKTVVWFNESEVDINNYELGTNQEFVSKYSSSTGWLEITWQIKQRTFEIPYDPVTNEWNAEFEFDGKIHDIMVMLGFEEGWENYFDVKITYAPGEHGVENYDPAKDENVGFSEFNLFYLGEYSVEITIKDEINKTGDNFVWLVDGNAFKDKRTATIDYKQLQLEVTGWNEDAEYTTVITEGDKFDNLPDDVKALFEYVIYEETDYRINGEKAHRYTVEEIAQNHSAGVTYIMMFRVKPEHKYAVSTGIKITYDGADEIYYFGNYDFGTDSLGQEQPIIWLPTPGLVTDSYEFTGRDITFNIADWSMYYALPAGFVADFNAKSYTTAEGDVLTLDTNCDSFLYSLTSGKLDTSDGTFKEKKAGEYKITLRFTPNINLSWYDPAIYGVDASGNLYRLSDASQTPITGTALEALIDRFAKSLSYEITPAAVHNIDISDIEEAYLEYTGTPLDITKVGDLVSFLNELKRTYGDLIEFTGDVIKTEVGDWELNISLADPDSSYWDLGGYTTEEIHVSTVDGYKLDWVREGSSYRLVFAKFDSDGNVVEEYNNGDYNTDSVKFKYDYRKQYIYIFDKLDNNLPVANSEGGYITRYAAKVGDNYVLRDYQINPDGTFATGDNGYIYTDVAGYDFVTEDGKYVIYNSSGVVTADGECVAVYELDEDGNRIPTNLLIKDGHYVVDDGADNFVTVQKRNTSKAPIILKWHITPVGIAAPYIDPDKDPLVFTGKEIVLAESGILKGFDPENMEITDGGSGINVGEFTAVIRLKGGNFFWDGTDLDYVTVTWTINKATVDLSNVKWGFSWIDEGDYEDAVFGVDENGNPNVYWVYLDNLPEALEGYVKYTTNRKAGAYAGKNAGVYKTEFRFDVDYNNVEAFDVPATLGPVTWHIRKLKLEIPQTNQTWMIFDDGVHNLMDMIELSEDWQKYYEVSIRYSPDFSLAVPYPGYDANGNGTIEPEERYLAHGAGAYTFVISIKNELNATHKNVVWAKAEDGEDGEEDGEPISVMFLMQAPESEGYAEILEPEYDEAYDESKLLEEAEKLMEESAVYAADGTPGDSEIVDPDPDPDDEDDDLTDGSQQIIVGIDKLVIGVDGWTEKNDPLGADPKLNKNPHNKYTPEILESIEKLLSGANNPISTEIIDLDGNVVTGTLQNGHTYFVRIKIAERYKNFIEIEYAEGVPEFYDIYIGTPDNTYTRVPDITDKIPSQEYTGKEITFVLDFLVQHEAYLQIVESLSDARTQINAGKYSVTVCFRDGMKYCWTSGGREAVTFIFEITPKPIKIELNIESIPYTGEAIDIEAELKKLSEEYEYIKVLSIVSGKQTEVGKYEVKLGLNPAYGGNIVWSDEMTVVDGTVVLEWEITQAIIGGEWDGETGTLKFESETGYTGSYKEVVKFTYIDIETSEVVTGKRVVGKRYKVIAELIDTKNFRWADGFVAEFEFTQQVEMSIIDYPEFSITIDYTGQEIIFEIRGNGNTSASQYAELLELIVEKSSSLTQIEAGVYEYWFRFKDNSGSWVGGSAEDIKITLTIAKAKIEGTWNEHTGKLILKSESYKGSFDAIVDYVYIDVETNTEVKYSELVEGKEYKVTAILKDEKNFEWKSEIKELTFIYSKVEVITIPKPELSISVEKYTGSAITFVIKDWEKWSESLEIAEGQLRYTEAGVYTVTIKLKDESTMEWSDGTTGTITLTFEITKAVLSGEWGADGKVKFESTFTGNYDDVVKYKYYKLDGTEISASELVEGESYKAIVELKEGSEKNFEFAEGFETEKTFKYSAAKKGLSWWMIMLIILSILVILLIIIIIIVIIYRRRKAAAEAADEYEDYGEGYDGEFNYDGENADYESGDAYGEDGYGESGSEGADGDIYAETTDYGDSADYSDTDNSEGSY